MFVSSVKCVDVDAVVFVAAKLELRLTLFYVCNEVVQTCRKKHAVVYKDAFKEILRDAALLVRLLAAVVIILWVCHNNKVKHDEPTNLVVDIKHIVQV